MVSWAQQSLRIKRHLNRFGRLRSAHGCDKQSNGRTHINCETTWRLRPQMLQTYWNFEINDADQIFNCGNLAKSRDYHISRHVLRSLIGLNVNCRLVIYLFVKIVYIYIYISEIPLYALTGHFSNNEDNIDSPFSRCELFWKQKNHRPGSCIKPG